jgi:enoyl-CoA hydratase
MPVEIDEPVPGIVRLAINRPPVNALDIEAIAALTRAFHRLAAEPPASGALLTGTAKAFCAGVDVTTFAAFDHPGRLELAQAITAMTSAAFAVPCPLVALIGGHALGGGLILPLAADWRIAVDNPAIKLGLLEAKAGVPFPAGPMAILKHMLPGALTRQLTLSSKTLSPAESHDCGLIDELCTSEELLERGLERIVIMASQPGFAIVKRQVIEPVARELRELVHRGAEPFWESLPEN